MSEKQENLNMEQAAETSTASSDSEAQDTTNMSMKDRAEEQNDSNIAMDVADDTDTVEKKPRPKWLMPVIATGTLVALLAAGGITYGVVAHNTYMEYEQASAQTVNGVKSLKDAISAAEKITSTVKADQLADPDLLDELTTLIEQAKKTNTGTDTPNQWLLWETKPAVTKQETLRADVVKLDKNLTEQTSKVVKSKEEKELNTLLEQANQLMQSSNGNVQDNATRDTLQNAINKKDTEAITKAMQAVTDSVNAKAEADRKAAEEAAQAQAEAAAAAQAQQYSSAGSGYGYSGRTSGRTGSNGGNSGGSSSGNKSSSSWDYKSYTDSKGNHASPLNGDSWGYTMDMSNGNAEYWG